MTNQCLSATSLYERHLVSGRMTNQRLSTILLLKRKLLSYHQRFSAILLLERQLGSGWVTIQHSFRWTTFLYHISFVGLRARLPLEKISPSALHTWFALKASKLTELTIQVAYQLYISVTIYTCSWYFWSVSILGNYLFSLQVRQIISLSKVLV